MKNKNIIIILIAIIVILVIAVQLYYVLNFNKPDIIVNNFIECVNAGYAVMESYPRQCIDSKGNLFIEEINNDDDNPPIGGDKDSYGCIIGAGYSWNNEINACIREWEFTTESERKAITIATKEIDSYTTVENVETVRCPGCYNIMLKRNDNERKINVNLIDWNVKSIMTYCTNEDKFNDICTREYMPVCGWFNSDIKCIKYPCAQTYGNKCEACSAENVEYYTEGECPN